MQHRNVERLFAAAGLLRPVLGDLVFVGGAVTSLLATDEGAGAPRATLDVDAIAEVTSYAAYAAFGDRLRALGFAEDASEGAPLCRWVQGETILDVIPLDERALGFSNRWYRDAIHAAVAHHLSPDLEIRVISAPHFLATKIAAYHGRGKDDVFASHDLEDMIFVIDGRPTIVDEVRAGRAALRQYLRIELGQLLGMQGFIDALPGYLMPDAASQARLGLVIRRMEALAAGA